MPKATASRNIFSSYKWSIIICLTIRKCRHPKGCSIKSFPSSSHPPNSFLKFYINYKAVISKSKISLEITASILFPYSHSPNIKIHRFDKLLQSHMMVHKTHCNYNYLSYRKFHYYTHGSFHLHNLLPELMYQK